MDSPSWAVWLPPLVPLLLTHLQEDNCLRYNFECDLLVFWGFFFASTLSKPMLIVIVTEAFHSSLPSLSGQRSKALSEHPSWMDGSFLFIFFFIFLLSCSFSLRSSYLLWWHDSWVLVAVQWILFLCSGEKDEVPFGLSKDNRENRFERLI